MIILHGKNSNHCYSRPVQTTVGLSRDWVIGRLKNEPIKSDNVSSTRSLFGGPTLLPEPLTKNWANDRNGGKRSKSYCTPSDCFADGPFAVSHPALAPLDVP